MELQRWQSMFAVEPVAEERIVIGDVPWKPSELPARAADGAPAGANVGRLPVAVATTGWTVAWERPFPRASPYGSTAAVNGKIFSMSGDSNALLDLDGKSLLDPMPRMHLRGGVFVDHAKERVFVSNDGVHELARGSVRFLQPAMGFPSANLVVNGDRLLASGAITGQHPHGGPITRKAVISVLDLADAGADATKILVDGVSDIAVDASPGTIAFVIPGELHLLPWDLAKGRALTAPERFTPLSVTLDEEGRAYLIAAVEARIELWIVEPDGRRRARTVIPLERVAGTPDSWPTHKIFLAAPPKVDRDHRVYVKTGRRSPTNATPEAFLFAFTPSGAVAWKRDLTGNGGLALTADDRVLLTDRDSLVLLDAAGGETLLFRSPDALITPPVVVRADAIALATEKTLFLLRAPE